MDGGSSCGLETVGSALNVLLDHCVTSERVQGIRGDRLDMPYLAVVDVD